jgi:hypothetical protein
MRVSRSLRHGRGEPGGGGTRWLAAGPGPARSRLASHEREQAVLRVIGRVPLRPLSRHLGTATVPRAAHRYAHEPAGELPALIAIETTLRARRDWRRGDPDFVTSPRLSPPVSRGEVSRGDTRATACACLQDVPDGCESLPMSGMPMTGRRLGSGVSMNDRGPLLGCVSASARCTWLGSVVGSEPL